MRENHQVNLFFYLFFVQFVFTLGHNRMADRRLSW